MTLGQSEIEENVVGSSSYVYLQPEQIPEYNVEGLRPNIEIQQPTIDTTIAGAISLNLDEFSCLEADQMPQNVRQSLMNLSYLHQIVKAVWERNENLLTGAYIILYNYNLYFYILYCFNLYRSDDLNAVPDKKQKVKKYDCKYCDKSYTQSHNLKKHCQKEHGL